MMLASLGEALVKITITGSITREPKVEEKKEGQLRRRRTRRSSARTRLSDTNLNLVRPVAPSNEFGSRASSAVQRQL